jgi:hypothetical protein
METSEAVPASGVHAPDLAGLFAAGGPFATVYLTTEPDVDNQAARSEVRWRNLRRDLEEAGVAANVLDEVEQYVTDAHRLGAGLAVVATGAEVLHAEHGDRPPSRDGAWWAPLPRLTGILEWRQQAPPYVLVLVDRIGADIVGVRPGAEDLVVSSEGHDVAIRKVGPGGWSQRRFQQRAENFWNDNAKGAAELLVRVADAVEPIAIYVAGDVRALQLLREATRDDIGDRLVEVTGGRSADGSADETEAEVSRLTEVAADRETATLLEHLAQERGQRDRASEGIAATLGALSAAQVDTLLVVDEIDDGRTAWFGPEPVPVAAMPGDLETLGVEDPQEGRLIDVLVRAALGTAAGVRIVPAEAGLADGVAAILRWSS